MKKIFTFLLLLSFAAMSFVSCRSSKSSTKDVLGAGTGMTGTVVKTVATVVGVILLTKLIKSVLGTVSGTSIFGNTTKAENFAASFNEDTKLNSFVKNDLLSAGLQALVAEHYKIPLTTVANSYSSLITVGDLATFIGKHADAKVLREIK